MYTERGNIFPCFTWIELNIRRSTGRGLELGHVSQGGSLWAMSQFLTSDPGFGIGGKNEYQTVYGYFG